MKIHILMTPDPPLFGTELQALCGAGIPSAVPLVTSGEMSPSNTVIFCGRCLKISQSKFRYVAWIVSGEEGKQLEAGKETYES